MWNVPVDHEMFKEINPAQWLWYYHNFIEDAKEKFETNRDLIEYHASFIEPDAVKKIREARDQTVMVPEKQFMSGIEKIFGRTLSSAEKPKEREIQKANMTKILTDYKNLKTSERPNGFSYKDWLNVDLEK